MSSFKKLSGHYIAGFVDGEGCFDLQFRRDVRHKREGKPVYYSWKVQFAIVSREDEKELFEKIKNTLNCGEIYFARGDQVRYSVQKIDTILNYVVPFFEKYPLCGKKKKDFSLWVEAVNILNKNKKCSVNIKKGTRGFVKSIWNKNDFKRLVEIHKEMQLYKSKRPRGFKWISEAESMIEKL